MAKIDVAGLQIDNLNKHDAVREIEARIAAGKQTFVTTPYSEFLYAALTDPEAREMLNKADIALPDGIGILWAATFLRAPFHTTHFYAKVVEAFLQMVWTGARIVLAPHSVRGIFPEKISGSEFVFDLAHLAERRNWSVYLLGGFGDTPQRAADALTARFPKLHIAGTSTKDPNDQGVLEDIKKVHPDMLFVAYGPLRQERWILAHKDALPQVKFFIGLGGTFDYLAGKKLTPPNWMRALGLEWLFRLLTQPHRLSRIITATLGLIRALMRYKIYESLPYRKNVAVVIFRPDGTVFAGKRNPIGTSIVDLGEKNEKFKNYWQFPQGGLEKDEPIEEAALREGSEETGIKDLSFVVVSDQSHAYTWKSALRPLLANPFQPYRFRHKGQKQNVVYLLAAKNASVHIDNLEFTDYAWVPVVKLRDVLHPERHSLVAIVETDYAQNEILKKALNGGSIEGV